MADRKLLDHTAQAGLIVVVLDREAEISDVRTWEAATAEVLNALPLAPAASSNKKRKTSKGKAVAARPTSEGPLIRALALVGGIYATFTYRIQRKVLYLRVYLHLDNGDVPADYVACMRKIMWRTMRAWEVEEVQKLDMSNGVGPLIMLDKDPRTLGQIYQNIPSPSISQADKRRMDPAGRAIIKQLEAELGPRGLKDDEGTKRLMYQNNSVMRMILLERSPEVILDPAWSQLEERGHEDGKRRTFWLNSIDYSARRTDQGIQRAELQRGGCLWEEMGCGKTLMSLCLMLATKSHITMPPLDVHPSRVITQHALETFPFPHYQAMRAQHGVEYKDTFAGTGKARMGVPKLSKLAAFQFLRAPSYTERTIGQFFGTVAEDKLRNIKPFYFVPEQEDQRQAHDRDLRSNWRRAENVERETTWRKRYLTGCSLVIMPSLLIPQWKKQIAEHFEPGTFEVEIVDNVKLKPGQDRIPPLKRLVQLDILLMAKEAFARENSVTSRLFDIHFKRVLYDEGHMGTQGLTGNVLMMAKKIVSESRWAITGTPATHLIGDRENMPNVDAPMELASSFAGSVKQEMPGQDAPDEDALADQNNSSEAHPDAASRPGTPESFADVKPDVSAWESATPAKPIADDSAAPDGDEYQGPALADAWSKDATADLAQLGKIFTELLFMPLLSNFDIAIKKAASDKRGPQVNVVAKLDALLRKVVVRHQARDIEAEQPIPSLSIYQTGFNMSHIEKLTYNFMQAVVARNSVSPAGVDTVGRKIRDKAALFQILENLKATSVWYAGGNMHAEHILDALRKTELRLRERIDAGKDTLVSRDNDITTLQDGQRWVMTAMQDPAWSAIMQTTSLPVESLGDTIPKDVADAWALCDGGMVSASETGVEMIAEHMLRMRDYMQIHNMGDPKESVIELIEQANDWRRKLDEVRRQQEILAQVRSEADRMRGRKLAKKIREKTKADALRNESMRDARKIAREWQQEENDDDVVMVSDDEGGEEAAINPLMSVSLIFNTMSAKISWIVHEVQRCPADTFVVFSHVVSSLAYIKEALDLAHVPTCHVAGDGPVQARQLNLAVFQAGLKRVCLMDIKLAARGLNLVVANRIIFCEPVWQKDVEAQALKRVHRIGQRRTTASHCLYLKGTTEERKLQRRAELDATQRTGAANETDDDFLHSLIRHPLFNEDEAAVPVRTTVSLTGQPIKGVIAEDAAQPEPVLAIALQEQPRGQKRVHLANIEEPAQSFFSAAISHPRDLANGDLPDLDIQFTSTKAMQVVNAPSAPPARFAPGPPAQTAATRGDSPVSSILSDPPEVTPEAGLSAVRANRGRAAQRTSKRVRMET